MRWIKFALTCVAAAALAVFTAVHLGSWELRERERQIAALQRERTELIQYAERLSASRRVAQVDIVKQDLNDAGVPVTTLLWQEVNEAGTRGKPLTLQALGEQVYFEAYSLKFEPRHVGHGDPQRGVSLALFRRVFGDRQSPDSVAEIDRSARPPLALDAEASAGLEAGRQRMWSRFWEMVDDPRVAAQLGVRVAQDRKSTRLNSSHLGRSRMPSSA